MTNPAHALVSRPPATLVGKDQLSKLTRKDLQRMISAD